jgi:hypothetical protein
LKKLPPGRRSATDTDDVEAGLLKCIPQRIHIDDRVNGIAGMSMGLSKLQHIFRALACPDAAQADPSRRAFSQPLPRIGAG